MFKILECLLYANRSFQQFIEWPLLGGVHALCLKRIVETKFENLVGNL